jgi:hypothetical protein
MVAAVLFMTGCAGSAIPGTPASSGADSGIEGIALAGPQCPVEIEGSPCPPKPIAIRVVVRDRSGGEVVTFQTAADGRFRVGLPPGRYTLSTADQAVLLFLKPTEVNVPEGSYVELQLDVDTGIR